MAEGRGAIRAIIEAVDNVTAPVRRMGQGISSIIRSLNLDQARAQISRIVQGFGEVSRAALLMTTKIAASAIGVTTALTAMTRSVAETTQAAIISARSVNVSLQGWQQFAYAATLVGSSSDQMSGALGSLRDRALEAARGNQELRVAFRRMGVQLLDSRGQVRPTEQLMNDVADAFARVPDSARRTAAAVALFGEAGVALVPVLAQGSAGLRRSAEDARRLGLVMTEAEAGALTRFGASMSRMGASIRGVWNAIAVQLAPVLAPLIDQITEWIAANRTLIATNIAGYIRAIPGIIAELTGKVRALWAALRPVVAIFGEWVSWFGPLNTALLALGLYLGSGLIKAVAGLAVAIAGPMRAALATFTTSLRAGTGGMAAFNAALWANPIGVVLLAITALGAAAYLLVRYWTPIKAFFRGLWEGVKGAFRGFVGWLDGWTGGSATAAVEGIRTGWGALTGFFADLWGDGIRARFTQFTTWLSSDFVGLFSGEVQAIKTVWSRLPDFFSGMWNDVKGFATGFAGWLDGWTGGALTRAYDAIKAVWEGLPAFFSGLWDDVKASFDAVWGWIRPIIERIERVFTRAVPEASPAPSQPAISPGPDGQPRTVRRGTVNGARRFDDQAPDVAPNVRPVTPGLGQRVDVGGDLNIRVTDDRVEITRAEMKQPGVRVRASTDTGQVMALP